MNARLNLRGCSEAETDGAYILQKTGCERCNASDLMYLGEVLHYWPDVIIRLSSPGRIGCMLTRAYLAVSNCDDYLVRLNSV